jgi:transposase
MSADRLPKYAAAAVRRCLPPQAPLTRRLVAPVLLRRVLLLEPSFARIGRCCAAGLHRSSAFPAFPGLAVNLIATVVSWSSSWSPLRTLPCPVAAGRRVPASTGRGHRRRRSSGDHWRAAPPSFGSWGCRASNALTHAGPGASNHRGRGRPGRPWPP